MAPRALRILWRSPRQCTRSGIARFPLGFPERSGPPRTLPFLRALACCIRVIRERTLVRRLPARGFGRALVDAHVGLRPLAKQCHADYADVLRAPSARCVRIRMLREVERGDPLQALAPALDRQRLVWREHVARLVPVGRLPTHRVDAVNRHHCKYLRAGAVANAYLIFFAGPANDVEAALVRVHRQRASGATIEHRHISKTTDCGRRSGEAP